MPTIENNQSKTKSSTLIALALVSAGALGSTAYLLNQQQNAEERSRQERASKELAQDAQRTAERLLEEATLQLDAMNAENMEAKASVAQLEERIRDANAKADALQRVAGRNEKQARELADSKATMQQLRDQLASARDKELELRANADKANADREALAHQLGQREAATRMVNHAQLDALKGRKGKLTVKARSTKEVLMAFDLPEALAKGAQFKVTTPKGHEYSGADPAISSSREPSDATASVGSTSKPGAGPRTSRVDLKFRPSSKLEPGLYKVDISSGKDYLQTVYLKLR